MRRVGYSPFRGFETAIPPSSRVTFSSVALGGRAKLVCEIQIQCIIIVERRFMADRLSKAVDGNFVEREKKSFIVTLTVPTFSILEFMLASITLNIVANGFHKFEDDTHMRIDRPGLLRRTVNVGGGLSTRKYNRRSCTVDQASLFDTEIAYYFLHIGQYVDHRDVVIDVTGSVRNYLIDYREWYLSI
ncbi:hypothetical protein ALC56_09369 [Trachymyrmex septentrionalis]|uniref:Uncharacterized protein n=1 Tax=Trachymyrmex septentrionalis TaxID=34720 RepID=A0A195F8N4_9HYME|nr:hypothetical protein ALC56_09369 [Trachymyrmex septentrionalis]